MNKQMSVSMRLGLGFLVILALMVAVAVVSALKVDAALARSARRPA